MRFFKGILGNSRARSPAPVTVYPEHLQTHWHARKLLLRSFDRLNRLNYVDAKKIARLDIFRRRLEALPNFLFYLHLQYGMLYPSDFRCQKIRGHWHNQIICGKYGILF